MEQGKVDVLLGLQWGDEGKGKQIDEILSKYDSVCRFQGGPNAGHSYKYKGVTIIGHLMPSGSLHEKTDLIIGNGVVLNPHLFINKEYSDLMNKGIDVTDRLYISERAKLITYLHPFLDAAEECRMGKNSVGSTLTGIGPSYRDFKGRQIQLIGDILRPNFNVLSEDFLNFQMCLLKMYADNWGYEIPLDKIEESKDEWFMAIDILKNLQICDTSEFLRHKLADGKRILAEGAQGAMLDNDFGDYPFVTSSNTMTSNVCLGLGVSHKSIGETYGVIKAYTTKVGGGSFPSRIRDTEKEGLYQEAGHEFGATTGRRRMCGWLDLVGLRRAIYLCGVDGIYINKTDICPVDKIEVVTGYLDSQGELIKNFPLHLEDVHGTETIEFDGWGDNAVGVTVKDDLPKELLRYIDYVESEVSSLGTKILSLGTGSERGQSTKW